MERWALANVCLHWIIASLLIALFFLGDYMVALDYYDPWYQSAPFWHKSFGLLVVVLMLARVAARIYWTRPKRIEPSKFEMVVTRLVHAFFYVAVLAICLSGYLISTADGRPVSFFGLIDVVSLGEFVPNQEDVAGLWHKRIVDAVLIVAIIHAIAALKHHFVNRDSVLKRMLWIKS